MKTSLGSEGQQVYKITNDLDLKKNIKLYDRLDKAIEKTGMRSLLCDNPNGILLEASQLRNLIMNSIMQYNADNVELRGGHSYGERL